MAVIGIAISGLLQQVIALHLPLKYLSALPVTWIHRLIKLELMHALYLANSP